MDKPPNHFRLGGSKRGILYSNECIQIYIGGQLYGICCFSISLPVILKIENRNKK